MRSFVPRAAALLLGLTLLGACGTRIDHAAMVAGAGEDTVTLSPDSIRALTAPRPAAPQAAPVSIGAAQPSDTTSGRPAPQAPPRAGTARTSAAAPSAPARAIAPAAAQPTGSNDSCPTPLAPVAIGQIGLFSGVAGPITASMRPTLAAWAKDLNSRGGLACHPIEVYSEDDGGDAGRSAYLVQNMVARHHVVAFVAPAVLSPNGFLPAVEAAKVPVIGGPGGDDFRNSPWVFPEAASLDDQIYGFVRNGVERGKRKVGVLYCVEAAECTTAAKQIKEIARAAGGEEVYSAPVSVTQPDYTAQCLNARNAGVDQLVLGVDGASIGRVARSCDTVGYRPLFSTIAGILSPAQAADPLVRAYGIATATGDAPFFRDDTPGQREYHRVLGRWAPNTAPDGASIIAFTAAKLFEKAIANVAIAARSGPITPDLVVRGLGAVHNESLDGLTVGVTFSAGRKGQPSSGCVFYEFLTTTGWTAPNASRPICR